MHQKRGDEPCRKKHPETRSPSRARLTVTGVQKVLHCNADSAAMETGKGTLHLTGAQLNMAALDLETGEAKFTGRIDTLEYTASAPAGGFLRRLLR